MAQDREEERPKGWPGLPSEVRIAIFKEVMGGRPRTDILNSCKVPPQLALVNKQWNQDLTPALYTHFTYDGSFADMIKMFAFLRTIVTRPELGQLVRQLTLVTATSTLPQHPSGLINNMYSTLLHQNRALFDQAFQQAFSALPRERCAALRQKAEADLAEGKTEALEALVIAHCPSLQRLQLHMGHEDPFLKAVLDCATGIDCPGVVRARAFQKLDTLYLGPKADPDMVRTGVLHTNRAFVGKDLPLHLLPTLQELMVLIADPRVEIWVPDEILHTPSNLRRLAIRYAQDRDGNEFAIANLRRFLQYTSNLTQLSLSFPTSDGPNSAQRHHDLWTAIYHLRENLEYLDLSIIDFDSFVPQNRDEGGFCPPLKEFTRLRYLGISAPMLYGFRCDHDIAYRFHNHLPPRLQSLGLYIDDAYTFNESVPRFPQEMINLVRAAPAIPLSSFVFDIDDADLWNGRRPPVREIRAEAKHRGVISWYEVLPFLFYAGLNTPFGATTYQCRLVEYRAFSQIYRVHMVIPKGMTIFGFRGELEKAYSQNVRY